MGIGTFLQVNKVKNLLKEQNKLRAEEITLLKEIKELLEKQSKDAKPKSTF